MADFGGGEGGLARFFIVRYSENSSQTVSKTFDFTDPSLDGANQRNGKVVDIGSCRPGDDQPIDLLERVIGVVVEKDIVNGKTDSSQLFLGCSVNETAGVAFDRGEPLNTPGDIVNGEFLKK